METKGTTNKSKDPQAKTAAKTVETIKVDANVRSESTTKVGNKAGPGKKEDARPYVKNFKFRP